MKHLCTIAFLLAVVLVSGVSTVPVPKHVASQLDSVPEAVVTQAIENVLSEIEMKEDENDEDEKPNVDDDETRLNDDDDEDDDDDAKEDDGSKDKKLIQNVEQFITEDNDPKDDKEAKVLEKDLNKYIDPAEELNRGKEKEGKNDNIDAARMDNDDYHPQVEDEDIAGVKDDLVQSFDDMAGGDNPDKKPKEEYYINGEETPDSDDNMAGGDISDQKPEKDYYINGEETQDSDFADTPKDNQLSQDPTKTEITANMVDVDAHLIVGKSDTQGVDDDIKDFVNTEEEEDEKKMETKSDEKPDVYETKEEKDVDAPDVY